MQQARSHTSRATAGIQNVDVAAQRKRLQPVQDLYPPSILRIREPVILLRVPFTHHEYCLSPYYSPSEALDNDGPLHTSGSPQPQRTTRSLSPTRALKKTRAPNGLRDDIVSL